MSGAPRPRLQVVILMSVAMALLFPGFSANTWGVADDEWFASFQRDSESLVIARLVQSRQTGLFSYGALTGRGDYDPRRGSFSHADANRAFTTYYRDQAFETFEPYRSQIGGQALVFGLLDRVIPGWPRDKVERFRAGTALLLAAVLTAVVVWFHVEYGAIVAVAVLSSALLSQWLTVFGRNLWWSTWAFYVPFAAMLWLVRTRSTGRGVGPRQAALVACAAMLVKCVFNGYEYFTTTILMMLVPLVHAGIRDGATARQTGRMLGAACAGAGAAMVLTAIVLVAQIASVDGSVADGFNHLGERFRVRTVAGRRQIGASHTPTVWVLRTYTTGTFVHAQVPGQPENDASDAAQRVVSVRYWHLLVLLPLATAALLIARRQARDDAGDTRDEDGRRNERMRIGLAAAAWCALLAPVSWLVIFRAHSISHPHMNFIVWQMPFVLYLAAVCGLVAADLVRVARSRPAPRPCP